MGVPFVVMVMVFVMSAMRAPWRQLVNRQDRRHAHHHRSIEKERPQPPPALLSRDVLLLDEGTHCEVDEPTGAGGLEQED